MRRGAPRHAGASDRGMIHLVRLVLDDGWNPAVAAARLCELVDDPGVLSHMAARIRRAAEDRPSVVAERAVLTIELAIGGRCGPATGGAGLRDLSLDGAATRERRVPRARAARLAAPPRRLTVPRAPASGGSAALPR